MANRRSGHVCLTTIRACAASVLLLSCSSLLAQANSSANSSAYREARVESNSLSDEADNPDNTENSYTKAPQDFKNRLEQRRISEYASFDRALFNRSFDVGVGFSYGSSDAGVFAQRTTGSSVFVSTGINARLGLSMTLDRSRLRTYDTSGSSPDLLDQQRLADNTLGLNVLLLPETVRLPELVMAVSEGRSKSVSSANTRALSLSTTRTLESASLFTAFSVSKTELPNQPSIFQRSFSGSYFLTINHRLAAGLGFSVAKSSGGLSVPALTASVVYRAWPDWVLRFGTQQTDGTFPERIFGLDATYTYNP